MNYFSLMTRNRLKGVEENAEDPEEKIKLSGKKSKEFKINDLDDVLMDSDDDSDSSDNNKGKDAENIDGDSKKSKGKKKQVNLNVQHIFLLKLSISIEQYFPVEQNQKEEEEN